MRRLVFPAIAASGLFLGASGLVVAGPSRAFADDPTPTVSAPAVPGKHVCKVTDTKLDELSGLVATTNGFVVVDDSTDVASHKRIFFLDDKCKIVNEQQYSGAGPLDPEDMILAPDGQTLWIADTGDDGVRAPTPTHRNTVALWTMPADGSKKPKIHRLSYPEGDYHDAEALLLTGNGTPLIITKELGKPAGIYEPTAPLKTDNETGVPMKRVGEITVQATDTPGNTVARIGNKTIDGAAIAPGGGKVVLRTYTDALEWDVAGGDVLAALQTKPRVTGLPNEPFGEAISYSADGATFYTVSDMNGDHETANYIQQYTPATTAAVTKAAPTGTNASAPHWYSNLSIKDITLLVGGVGVLGVLLVAAGVIGIARSRRNGPTAPSDGPDGGAGGDPETELIGVGGAAQRSGVYGAAPTSARTGPAPTKPGGVYGGGGQRGVYGDPGPGYGRPQAGQPAGPPPSRGGQQPPQTPGRGGGVYGAPQGQPGRGPAGRPNPPGGNGQPTAGRGGGPGPAAPWSAGGAYGQAGRSPRDGYAQFGTRPEGRFDNPEYR